MRFPQVAETFAGAFLFDPFVRSPPAATGIGTSNFGPQPKRQRPVKEGNERAIGRGDFGDTAVMEGNHGTAVMEGNHGEEVREDKGGGRKKLPLSLLAASGQPIMEQL